MAAMVDEWARSGVRHGVVCPGSRSTPLALALAADGRITVHVRLDERSAGFVALGIGVAGAGPAVLCTTSGTAAAEVHAAVLEAHHAHVPLLVCTADRPAELHDVGAPQTVTQEGLFARAVRWQASPGVADLATASSWRSVAARAVCEAQGHPAGPGPVHLDLAFREPLVGRPVTVPPGRPDGAPWHVATRARAADPSAVAADIAALGLGRAGGSIEGPSVVDGVVVAGAGCGDADAVMALARGLGWPVLADPLSGCRQLDAVAVVAAADAILREPGAAARLRPQAVLRLGRPWASKVLNQWLDGLPPEVAQVSVPGVWPGADAGRVIGRVCAADPGDWCRVAAVLLHAPGAPSASEDGWPPPGGTTSVSKAPAAAPAPHRGGPWLGGWMAAEQAARRTIDGWVADHPGLTEPGVAHTVLAAVASGTTVFVASSMPVRDAEWYGPVRHDHPPVFANRGANGIDGVVSTAVGVALSGRPVVALVGDLAFLHDCTAWVRPAGPEPDCTVVVVDNGGGGIFSFLTQADELPDDVFGSLFATPQAVDVGRVAAGLDVPVTEVSDLGALAQALAEVPGGGLRVVHARVPGHQSNVAIHAEIHVAVSAAVRRALDATAR